MKTKTLLLLASLVILTTVVRAAQAENDVIVLPVYSVKAPRYSAVEKQINASLDEVRQLAKVPVAIPADSSVFTIVAKECSLIARLVPEKKAIQLAKS